MSDVQNKKHSNQQTVVRRRGFLAGAATTGAVGVAVVASGVLAKKDVVSAVTVDESASKGYQLSEHVRRYYRSTTV
jgi:hypothetical protein